MKSYILLTSRPRPPGLRYVFIPGSLQPHSPAVRIPKCTRSFVRYDRIVACIVVHMPLPVRAIAIPTMCQENLKQDSCYSYVRCNYHYYGVVFFLCSRLIVK